MSPIIEAMKPSPNSDRQSCASLGELFPKNGTAFATESPTTFVSSRPTIFGSSRRPGIAQAREKAEKIEPAVRDSPTAEIQPQDSFLHLANNFPEAAIM